METAPGNEAIRGAGKNAFNGANMIIGLDWLHADLHFFRKHPFIEIGNP